MGLPEDNASSITSRRRTDVLMISRERQKKSEHYRHRTVSFGNSL